jgi:hypothetical protein
MVSYEFLEKLTTSCKTRDDIRTVSGGSVPIEESPLPHHPHDQSWSKKNWVSVHHTHTQPRQGGRPGNDTQEDEKTRARVDKAQWEARWNLRKAFQTLTRTEDLSQDAGEQFQTKFPPHPHDARDPVPPPQPQEPRLEDFLDSVDANGNVVKGEFHVPDIVKLLRGKKWLGAQGLKGLRQKEHLLPLFDNTNERLHHLVIKHCLPSSRGCNINTLALAETDSYSGY